MTSEILEYADQYWRGEASAAPYASGELRRQGLHRIIDGVWMFPAMGNVYVFETGDGLLMFDTGSAATATKLYGAVRAVSDAALKNAIYTHGHIDHIWGTRDFDAEAATSGSARPTVIAHDAVPARFDRYRRTAGYNTIINQRQFQAPDLQWPTEYRYPDVTFADRMTLTQGGLRVELAHGRGETDDAITGWFPDLGIVGMGDFFVWTSPNAGNPQKVQRYALDWAKKLRQVAALEPELMLPGHGLPVSGTARVREALTVSAEYLEFLDGVAVDGLNRGATLDEVLHGFELPKHFLDKPFLKPTYDEPEFVVRNAWRLYGGWYDGDPSNLKPVQRSVLGSYIAELAGGPQALADRAQRELESGDDRLAAKLIQLAVDADPESAALHEVRGQIFTELGSRATSTMSKGIYAWAAAESSAVSEGEDPLDLLRDGSKQAFSALLP
ncbi:MBL fold metallo-hydrolase [Epidermidibacterium keratini]|uniref:MBL fold metallo-hydrolase n=1 Tax=Epidermidibacterium keratini TaxID=1891644 RepID=A0A7L4YN49_9ACTN|nr:alkyl sulfatase dimerization domain-containing protein [Epidermidibacterium keratini]QHC00580.1 MBL fold metallo-hydrolase [Epidermidibacterium keratini]